MLGMGVIIYGVIELSNILLNNKQVTDPANLTSLIVEIGVGITVTVIVFVLSDQQYNRLRKIIKDVEKQQSEISQLIKNTNSQQNEMSTLISQISEIEEKQNKFIENQEKFLSRKITMSSNGIRSLSEIIQYEILKEEIKLLKAYRANKSEKYLISIVDDTDKYLSFFVNMLQIEATSAVMIVDTAITSTSQILVQRVISRKTAIKNPDILVPHYDAIFGLARRIMTLLPEHIEPKYGLDPDHIFALDVKN